MDWAYAVQAAIVVLFTICIIAICIYAWKITR